MSPQERLQKLRRLKELRTKAAGGEAPVAQPADALPETAPISEGNSAMAGLAQGTAMGFGDELMGGIRAVQDVAGDKFSLGDLKDRYQQRRKEYRDYNANAHAQNPKSYTGGEIGGSVATTLVPGLGQANLGKTMVMGGLSGLGNSSADVTEGELAKAGGDFSKGMLTSGLAHGVASGVGKVAGAVGEKAGELYLKTSPKMLQTAGALGGAAKLGPLGYIGGKTLGKLGDKTARGIADALANGNIPEKFAPLLKSAAEKGPQQLALTFQLLSKKNPELTQSLQP